MKRLALLGLVALVCGGGIALAQAPAAEELPDYDPHSEAWNGMATWVGLAEGRGYNVDIKGELNWDQLGANDILVLVYPLVRVEPSDLSAFVQAGGNVVIADDFGESKDALATLGMLRAEVVTPQATKYQDGRVWAPIATPRSSHEIARDVDEVVTNHPAALKQIEGAEVVIGFEDSAVVVAGERGTGRFVAISDPSIFINRMMQYPGNVQLAVNIFDWLDRHGSGQRARNVVFVRGNTELYGDPRPFIDDPRGGKLSRSIAELNTWLWERHEWFLTSGATKVLATILALLLFALALAALPVRRGPKIDGGWLRFNRPARRDEPYALIGTAERQPSSFLVLACILRDQVQRLLADALPSSMSSEPLYTAGEAQLVAQLTAAKGTAAGQALARVYRRLRVLPSRSQAAAPWNSGHLARRDFDALYRDVAELCRTLGSPLIEVQEAA
ncbi:MAG TPA: DUF4350 domain-containing protein [Kofleriaceae bacterium]|nr:DUF4350 domain-containing protein [Kofleriaceae bacterium]